MSEIDNATSETILEPVKKALKAEVVARPKVAKKSVAKSVSVEKQIVALEAASPTAEIIVKSSNLEIKIMENFDKVKEAASGAIKDGLEKVTTTLTEVTTIGQANVDALVASSQIYGKGVGEAATIAATYTKSAFEKGVEAAKTLGSAKSLQEVVELQTSFAKTAYDTWMTEANKVAELLVSTGKEAIKPVSERANVVMSKFQIAE